MRRITITITVPDDVEVDVQAQPSKPVNEAHGELSSDVLDRIGQHGGQWSTWEEAWARWAANEAEAIIMVSGSTTKPGRIAAYPLNGRRRFAGLYAPSGRLAFPYLSHDHADGRLVTEIWDKHQDGAPATPAGVAVRLHSDEAVNAAKRLTEIALAR